MLTKVLSSVLRLASALKRRPIALLNAIVILLVASGVTAVSIAKYREHSIETAVPTDRPESSRVAIAPTTIDKVQNSETQSLSAQTKSLTPAEEQKLAAGINALVNQSTDGLKEVHHPDGSVSINLEDRFQNVMLATKDEDGKVTQACVDNRQKAAEFLKVNPELVGGTKPKASMNNVAPAAKGELK